jgi:hypothetical protein
LKDPAGFGNYALTTAAQIAGTVVGRLGVLLSLIVPSGFSLRVQFR